MVFLHFQVELGVVPIPKSVTKERIQKNIDVFDFELTESDRQLMDSFHSGKRLIGLSDAKHSKYWPFGIQYWI